MSTLEISLGIALTLASFLLFRLYRKQLILRHAFIRSSDWCARKIDEMTESASWCITDMVKQNAASSGHSITDEEARDHVPYVILDAKKEWVEQKEAFQSRLARNGISPLDLGDLDNLILNPGLAGLKP